MSAEFLIGGGKQRDPDLSAGPYATLLGRLIAAAPEVANLPTLLPSPPWTAWDHPAAATWPERDDRGRNPNLMDGPSWIDDSARRARDLLSAYQAAAIVGLAAAVWAAQGSPGGAAGDWSRQDRAAAWAAGLWVRLFNAKKDASEGGGPQLNRLRDELDELLYRAGLAD